MAFDREQIAEQLRRRCESRNRVALKQQSLFFAGETRKKRRPSSKAAMLQSPVSRLGPIEDEYSADELAFLQQYRETESGHKSSWFFKLKGE